jgi:hypothetical protein
VNIAQRNGLVLVVLVTWIVVGYALPLGSFATLAWMLVGGAGYIASRRWSNAGAPVRRRRALD